MSHLNYGLQKLGLSGFSVAFSEDKEGYFPLIPARQAAGLQKVPQGQQETEETSVLGT